MSGEEQELSRRDNHTAPDLHHQLELAVPSLATALHATPEERLDRHLGRGVAFRLGQKPETQLELFPQVVRVTLPHAQIAVTRTEAVVSPEGIAFEQPDRFLSVGARGEVLFQYFPPDRSGESVHAAPDVLIAQPRLTPQPQHARSEPQELPPPSPASTPAPKEQKGKSEKYVGRLGEIKTHWTKAGKFVAEVEVLVPDPERPGASRLVKLAAFNKMAEALRDSYRPGQEVTAVGIPHELKRTNRDGKEWTERQLYFVQLPKSRERPRSGQP